MDYELNNYNVYYKYEDTGSTYYTRISAEDEDHAREKFKRDYPHVEITEVDDCGDY